MEGIFNNRQIKLLEILSNSPQPLSRDYLSREMNISVRTVSNEIRAINSSRVENIQILVRRGLGYFLEDCNTPLEWGAKQELLDFNDIDSRIKNILRLLIEKNDYITIQDISEQIYVGRQTISSDLKEVKRILKDYELELKSRTGYGLIVDGSEENKRKCFSFSLRLKEYSNLFELNDYEKHLFEPLPIEKIFTIVSQKIKASMFVTLDGIEKIITFHIAISLMRIKKEMAFEIYKIEELKKYQREVDFTKELLSQVERELKIIFPEDEINYIAIYFISLTKTSIPRDRKFLDDVFNFLQNNYGRDYRNKNEFITGLLAHLDAFERRIKFKIWARNPLIKEIKQKYFFYFEMALSFLRNFYGNDIEADEGEVGFLALHFATADYRNIEKKSLKVVVVCAAGKCSGRLIEKMVLMNMENEVSYVEVLTYSEYKEKIELDCDLVLSSISVEQKNVPIVRIKSIPDVDDLKKIIQNRKTSKYNEETKLESLLYPELFFKFIGKTNKQVVLNEMCEKIESYNFAEDKFKESVFKREEISSTCIATSIAMPHSLNGYTKESSVAIGVCNDGVSWGDDIVKIVFLVNVNESKIKELDKLYDKVIKIMGNYDLIDKLSLCNDIENFTQILNSN